MKTLKSLLVGFLGLFLALGALQARTHRVHNNDSISAVDHNAKTITIGRGTQARTYKLDPIADITLNGQKAEFSELGVGMKVNLTLADEQTLRSITANGVAKQKKGRSHSSN